MKHIQHTIAVIALLFIAACQPDDGDKNTELNNRYSINSTEQGFGSVAATMIGDNLAILASPRIGLKSAEEIMEADEYLFVAISPTLNSREFDIKHEQQLFTITSTLAGAILQSVAPSSTDEVSEGRMCLTLANGMMTAEGSLRLANGTTFAFNLSAEASGMKANENALSRGNETKPIRAAFYRTESGHTTLYFTPGGISYFEELAEVSWYMYIGLDDRHLTGAELDIATLSDFSFGIEDNIYTNKSFVISSTDMQGATGVVAIKQLGEGIYTATINIEIGNTAYTSSFSGECIAHDIVPERKSNFLAYNGVETAITSASARLVGDVWHITLHAADSSSAIITAPRSFFDGNAKGFSQSADLTVSYDGRTYSKANGDSGTLTASIDDTNGMLTIHFTNYASLELDYSGAVTIE